MNSKNLSQTCTLIGVLLAKTVFSQTAIPPSAGDGSPASPYQISSIEIFNGLLKPHPHGRAYLFKQTILTQCQQNDGITGAGVLI